METMRSMAVFLFLLFIVRTPYAQVKMWEEQKLIPTWEIGPPEVNPSFSWSSRHPVYPYKIKEILTNNKVDKTYKACWLENEFIQILILPEIGGRLHGAKDKTNDYNFFYWQPTIKPALVGMTGAWISGGIEWNFPHGHRPTAFSPVSYRLVENDDGSKTVWVGETEWVFGMRWIVGMTLYPGKNVIEAKFLLLNPTKLRHRYQMWTTTAVNANENYQAIYPTRIMTGHGKLNYQYWPIHNGVDYSWWRNIPNASSHFAVEKGGFMGGYDHDKQTGTVMTANKYIVPGKKLWTWGTSPSGRIWEQILTEDQGPYFEPQLGAFSDNQPDLHWFEPGDIKSFSKFFYPVRDIGPFKEANVHGALNMEFEDDIIKLGVYSTSILDPGIIRLMKNEKTIFEERLRIDPGNPYINQIEILNASGDQDIFTLSLFDESGSELVSYRPEFLEKPTLPESPEPFNNPENITSNDELWHAGEILTKFRDPIGGRTYFTEAIKRDPWDSRSRISLAELDFLKAHYESALEHLDIAKKRDPDNGKLFFLRAVAKEALGDYESAYADYYRAVYFKDYLSIGYEQIAKIDIRNGNYKTAIEHINRAIEFNSINPYLWNLKSTALRLNGELDDAENAAKQAEALDPLNPWAINELIVILSKKGKENETLKNELHKILLDDHQYYIELSLNYANAGLYEDATKILEEFNDNQYDNALLCYYRGYFKSKAGKTKEAAQWYKRGNGQSVDFIFPFRLEALEVFKDALTLDPTDGKAHYYQGLVYAGIGEVYSAISHWQLAVKYEPENARAWRNLGLGMFHTDQDLIEAKKCYEKAFELLPDDSRILMEFDRVREALDESPIHRLTFLKKHKNIVESRNDLLTTMLELLNLAGQFNEASDYLLTHHFNNWEARYTIHNIYMDTYIGMAKAAKTPQEALKFYLKANEYPENLEVAPREPNLRGFLYHPMSKLYRELGNEKEAVRLLTITANESSSTPDIGCFFQALALRDLGRIEEAEQIIYELEQEGHRLINNQENAPGYYYLSKSNEFYGKMDKAREYLDKAVQIDRSIDRSVLINAQISYARGHQ